MVKAGSGSRQSVSRVHALYTSAASGLRIVNRRNSVLFFFLILTQGYVYFFLDMFINFRERMGRREVGGERNTDVRETLIGHLPYVPQLGTKPTT